MDFLETLNSQRDAILRIARKHGAFNVRVFGSVARGESDERSDVDFLVAFEPGRSLMDHAALLLELEALLGRRVDVVSERSLRPRVLQAALEEAVPV